MLDWESVTSTAPVWFAPASHTKSVAGFDALSSRTTAPPKASAAMRQVLDAMDEGNTNITKMLETLLARIDDQKVAHEKKIELQAAFNAQISQEMLGLLR